MSSSVLGSVVAGFPSPAEPYEEHPLDLNRYLVSHPEASYFVRVVGDSMTGAGIREGDVLVVDRSLPTRPGDIVIAAVDGEFTVKYFRQDARGVFLEAANPAYAPIHFASGSEVDLFGRVTAVIHRF